MKSFIHRLNRGDRAFVRWMAEHGVVLLRVSLGIIFLWFGGLKFVPDLSPAEDLAQRTIETVSFGVVQPPASIILLATVECLIGVGLITGVLLRATLLLLWLQMLGTVLPLFLFPQDTFIHAPYAPTLEGQYIIKNLVIISASLVIGGQSLRGGEAILEPGDTVGSS